MSIKITTEDYIKRAKAKHGDKYDYSKLIYVNMCTNVFVRCNTCNFTWMANPQHHLYMGRGCRKCADIQNGLNRRKSLDNFVNEATNRYGDKYEYIEGYRGVHQHINVKCNVCTYIFKTTPGDILQKDRREELCPNCLRIKQMDTCKQRARLANADRYEYFNDFDNAWNVRDKIKILCKDCNQISEISISRHIYDNQGCKNCAKYSKGERRIEKYLSNHNTLYIKEKKFSGCVYKSLLRFDFYLPNYNLCIEYDGRQHLCHLKGWVVYQG